MLQQLPVNNLEPGRYRLDITLEDGTVKRVGVTRAHMEEDAGKSVHENFDGESGIDTGYTLVAEKVTPYKPDEDK